MVRDSHQGGQGWDFRVCWSMRCVFFADTNPDDHTSPSGDVSHHDTFSKYWFEMVIEMPPYEGAGPASPSSTTTLFTSLDNSPTLYYRGVNRMDSVCE